MKTQDMIKNWECTQAYIVAALEDLREAQSLGLAGCEHMHLKRYMELFKEHVTWRKAMTKRLRDKATKFNRVEKRLLTRDEVFRLMRTHENALTELFAKKQ